MLTPCIALALLCLANRRFGGVIASPLFFSCAFGGLILLALLSLAIRKPASVTFDDSGVVWRHDGYATRYAWQDIDRVQTITVDLRSNAKVVKIVRRGELADLHSPVGAIRGNFGIDPEQLAALIRTGKTAADSAASAG